jgi:vacuolar-type H+-ATPase subunit H
MAQEKVKDVLELIKKKEEEIQNESRQAEQRAKEKLQKRLEELRLQIEREKEAFENWLVQTTKERRTQIQLKKQELYQEHQNQLESHRKMLLGNVDRAVDFALRLIVKK